MKLIMLDVDGVLNSKRFMIECKKKMISGTVGIDPSAVVHLNSIVKESGAKVVISSSWRYGHPLEEMRELLAEAGFVGEIISETPKSWEVANAKLAELYEAHGIAATEKDFGGRLVVAQSRGAEIDLWLRTWPDPVESFVILDDDSDTAPHKNRHVKTDFDDGLTEAHVELALHKLSVPWKRPAHHAHKPEGERIQLVVRDVRAHYDKGD